jgi:hypothetical protein
LTDYDDANAFMEDRADAIYRGDADECILVSNPCSFIPPERPPNLSIW